MSVTTVRVPVTIGHSAAVWVELDADADPDDVRALLREVAGNRGRRRSRRTAIPDAPSGRRHR